MRTPLFLARAILERRLQTPYLYKIPVDGSTGTARNGQSYFTRTTWEAAYGRFPLFFYHTGKDIFSFT